MLKACQMIKRKVFLYPYALTSCDRILCFGNLWVVAQLQFWRRTACRIFVSLFALSDSTISKSLSKYSAVIRKVVVRKADPSIEREGPMSKIIIYSMPTCCSSRNSPCNKRTQVWYEHDTCLPPSFTLSSLCLSFAVRCCPPLPAVVCYSLFIWRDCIIVLELLPLSLGSFRFKFLISGFNRQ